ncbi:MAG TPA: hypothetical protein VKM94_14745 [Blastocatellia bacterium]|nr:hypothetical protein [Blastocatellia bacterium]
MPALESLGASNFMEYVNTTFRIMDEVASGTALKLTDVVDIGESHGQVQFSLRFLGPLDRLLLQSTYRIDHDKLGELSLFLVPIGRDESGFQYEAFFNRFVKK